MKTSDQAPYTFTFLCQLWENKKLIEDFTITLSANGLFTAEKKVDDFLQTNWGWMRRRTYKSEVMKSDKYWIRELTSMTIL